MFRNLTSVENFIRAAADGNIDVIRRYLNENNNDATAINAGWKNGETALIAAIRHNQLNVVDLLLGVNYINVNAADQDGNTPLIVAAIHGRTDAALKLLSRHDTLGDAVNQDGFSALHKAAQFGHMDIVRLLLGAKVALDTRNRFKHDAAEIARRHGQREIAELIISALPGNPAHPSFFQPRSVDITDSDLGFGYDQAEGCTIF